MIEHRYSWLVYVRQLRRTHPDRCETSTLDTVSACSCAPLSARPDRSHDILAGNRPNGVCRLTLGRPQASPGGPLRPASRKPGCGRMVQGRGHWAATPYGDGVHMRLPASPAGGLSEKLVRSLSERNFLRSRAAGRPQRTQSGGRRRRRVDGGGSRGCRGRRGGRRG